MRGPTVRHRRLAAELRRYRTSAGYTCEQVAEELDCSDSKISRVETGGLKARPRDVRDMLDLYGVARERRDKLITLARESSRRKSWWHVYEDVVTEWFSVYVELETEARSVRNFEPLLVPGLLQTERYARAVIQAADPSAAESEVDRWATLRNKRQDLLTQEKPLHLWAIVDEAALSRPIGGSDVMAEQLEHLRRAADGPNITFQVVPFGIGAHASLSGPFHILEFPDPEDHDVVYLENQASGLFLEDPEKVRGYCQTFDHLRAAALRPDESARLVADVVERLA